LATHYHEHELKGYPNSIDFRLTDDELKVMIKRAAQLEREARLHEDKLDEIGARRLWNVCDKLTAWISFEKRFDR
jgi:ATP-dependent protease HslVU (ClpYQ) ATPase subunit